MAVLECAGLSKSYGAVKALEDINLKVEPGRVVGLLGPNGSGKTTLIKLANGLLQPSAGQILVCGRAPGPETKAEVSYMPERLEMPEWTKVRRLVDFFADFYADFDRERAAALLTRLGIDGESRLRQKVQLSLVMSRRAKLYLLDEPFGGMDPASRDMMLETVMKSRAPEAAVVLSTHMITDVEQVLDDVVFIDRGGVRLSSPAAELRAREGKSVDELFREVFRC
jgi:ABC-2 type transport system ATP-binding protein